ncbi:DUF4382 domain-containing protein [Reinekea marinisedimentorum]|uniref:Uncharacterized protein DUF4382 n=1 Tax=Reinekea marinisedimentorum TaxID=230495 RepID=A0A4R3I5R6_9GAMM|nr:DUF4382 domain-containing protein [Reinekea marinisedimentorum]TCS41038.1 uncharacterized protein DUF4382 [Reinekea marinisedimentorum]
MKGFIATAACIVALSACNTDDSSQTETGYLSLQMTDGAVTNAVAVYLTASAITLKGPDGQLTYTFTDEFGEPMPKQIDLLTLTGDSAEAFIEDWEVTAGEYQWLRLHSVTEGTMDTYVELDDGSVHELTIPSGDLKLVSGFTVPANGSADFTVDIDLNKALVHSASGYKLKPAMRLVDNAEAGHIAGSVDGNIYSANECTQIAVYAFAGSDTEADDIFAEETDPELIAWAVNETGDYDYQLGFLSAGAYTLHLACDPEDDPEADDELNFIEGQSANVTVINGETVLADFNL